MNAPIKVKRAKNQGSWDHGPLKSPDRGRPFFFTKSDGPQFLHDFSYKNPMFFLCNLNFRLNREEIKLFWTKFVSSS